MAVSVGNPNRNQDNDELAEARIEALANLAKRVSDSRVVRYLEESIQCFRVGAYNGAVVSAWCAVARYLRLVLERIGRDIVKTYVDKDIDSLDGQPLYNLCDKVLDLEKSFGESKWFRGSLHNFWQNRCNCAHPTDVFLDEETSFNLVNDNIWLIGRSTETVYLKYTVVLECVDNKQFSLNPTRARSLVDCVARSDHESLATALLRKFLSPTEEPDSQESDVGIDERILVVWEAVGEKLEEASRRRLMQKLADGLEVSKRQFDVVLLSRLIFWADVEPESRIWQYFDDWLEDDSITRGVVVKLQQYAPSPYRERAKAWPNFIEEDT